MLEEAVTIFGKVLNPISDLRMPESPRGALFLHRDSEKNPHVFPLLGLLASQDADTRAAAIQYFLEPELKANAVVTKGTTTVIK